MPFCVAYGCNYTTKKGINKAPVGVTFHRFPKDKKLWSVWVKRVSRKDWKPVFGQDYRLCSNHFEKDDFKCAKDKTTTQKRNPLKSDAIPSIFTHRTHTCSRRSSSWDVSTERQDVSQRLYLFLVYM